MARSPRIASPARRGGREHGRLLELMERAWRGPAWHGSSVLESIDGVTASEAAARPIRAAHSIGELVLHMAAWKRVVRLRLAGKAGSPAPEQNFPAIRASATEWKRARARLSSEHAALRRAVTAASESRMASTPTGGQTPLWLQVHGVIQHDLWHAGQILLLRRAIEGGAEARRPR